MGFDRLSNFLNKNLNYSYNFVIEELKRKFLGNHILFDLNFIIYNQMFYLEEEINKVIKIVLNLPFCYSQNNKTEDKLLEIFDLPWWKKNCENIEFIFDGDQEDEIISKLINFINTKQDNNLNKIDLMLIDKVIIATENYIENYTNLKNIQTIGFFIDGIPSFSKIMEQRKRRTKNYFESINRKKKFKDYFGNIKNFYMEEDGIKYNYFKWVDKRFSLDKSFNSISPIIKRLEIELLNYYKKKYSKVDIYINPGSINGESDIKIFQFIQSKNLIGDILIHTTDSDLIHLILVQQVYLNYKRIDSNISIIRHNSKDEDFIQYFDGNAMINAILKYYNEISNQTTNDFRVIYDFCFLLWFFGNDHLPSSFEFGPEIGIEQIFKTYSNAKKFIINLENDTIDINFDNLKLILIEFKKNINSSFSKILLNRNFKLTLNLVNLLTDTDKLNMNFDEILELIKNILINDGMKLKDLLDHSDIRFKIIRDYKIEEFNFENYLQTFLEKKILSVSHRENMKNQLLSNISNIIECLDMSFMENFGLVSYKKPFLKTNDNYQDLYNILSENTVSELNHKNRVLYEPQKEEFIKFNNNNSYNYDICYSYIKKIFHLSTSFFGNLNKYHTNNITAYSFDYVPKIEHLIKYLEENNDLEKIKKEIMADNLNENEYFNSVNHHIFITAYLSIEDIKDNTIKNKTKLLNLDNLWIGDNNIETFYHNKVPALNFLNNWDKELEIPCLTNSNDFD